MYGQVPQVLFLLFNRKQHKTNKNKGNNKSGTEHLQVGTNVGIVISDNKRKYDVLVSFAVFRVFHYLCSRLSL